MLMFTLAISYLNIFNLSWFMELTFQVPVQYFSLHYQTLLLPWDTSTTQLHFCFGSASSFLLKLFLCSSPVAYWTPTDLGGSYYSVITFCLFNISMFMCFLYSVMLRTWFLYSVFFVLALYCFEEIIDKWICWNLLLSFNIWKSRM